MTHPPTAWESPQFALIPDDAGPRMYANVSNELTIEDGLHDGKTYPVVVPTALFTMMRDIMHIEPDAEAFMYLVKEEDKYVFGLAWSLEEFTDLWSYSEGALPPWLKAEVVE